MCIYIYIYVHQISLIFINNLHQLFSSRIFINHLHQSFPSIISINHFHHVSYLDGFSPNLNPVLLRRTPRTPQRYGVCRLVFEVAAAGDWTNSFEIDVLMQRHLQPLGSGTTEAAVGLAGPQKCVEVGHVKDLPGCKSL